MNSPGQLGTEVKERLDDCKERGEEREAVRATLQAVADHLLGRGTEESIPHRREMGQIIASLADSLDDNSDDIEAIAIRLRRAVELFSRSVGIEFSSSPLDILREEANT